MGNNHLSYVDFTAPQTLEQLAKCININPALLERVAVKDKSKLIIEENAEFLIQGYLKQYGPETLHKKIAEGSIPFLIKHDGCLFQKHKIPKKRPTQEEPTRIVWEALPPLADAYKAFNRRFNLFARKANPPYPRPDVYGYVRKKNTFENARMHCGGRLILHADIKSFFPSISIDRINTLFCSLGIRETMAEILSCFVTIEDKLPLGLHPSPMLSNLICLSLDEKLAALASNSGCIYTRYADDITISGKDSVPSKESIMSILAEEDFHLSERKFRLSKPGQAHFVTGLSVNEKLPHSPKPMKKKLRQELYYCDKFGVREHLKRIDGKGTEYIQRGVNRIDGCVRYISYIEEDEREETRMRWRSLLRRDRLSPAYPSFQETPIRFKTFFVDETVFEFCEEKYMALCLVEMDSFDEAKTAEQETKTLYDDTMADPYSGGRKNKLQKNKLHWTDLTDEQKYLYSEKLSSFSFRSYISFAKQSKAIGYEHTYLKLLEALLPRRMKGCDRAIVDFLFEENPQVSLTKIEETCRRIYSGLEAANDQRPRMMPQIKWAKKKDQPCLSLPDALLGIFGSYARMEEKNKKLTEDNRPEVDWPMRYFEKVRDKIRVIQDVDKNISYSRRRKLFLPLEHEKALWRRSFPFLCPYFWISSIQKIMGSYANHSPNQRKD